MHRTRLAGLQQLVLWAGVLAVVVGLLAMHHMSRNHIAADAFAESHAHVGSESTGEHLSPAAAEGTVDHPALQPAGSNSHIFSDAGETCPGCDAHQAMTLTCLVALALLAVSALRRVPLRGPGLLVRPIFRAVLGDRGTWRARPPLTLMEISVSRT